MYMGGTVSALAAVRGWSQRNFGCPPYLPSCFQMGFLYGIRPASWPTISRASPVCSSPLTLRTPGLQTNTTVPDLILGLQGEALEFGQQELYPESSLQFLVLLKVSHQHIVFTKLNTFAGYKDTQGKKICTRHRCIKQVSKS